jgi:hypothetical protein
MLTPGLVLFLTANPVYYPDKKKELLMKASGIYSKGLNGASLADGAILTLTINGTKLFQMEGQNDKLEINFGEIEKTLILNVTNNDFLVAHLGDETDEWPGSKIKLAKKKLDRPFKGATHTLQIVAAKRPPIVSGGIAMPAPTLNNSTFPPDVPFDDQF